MLATIVRHTTIELLYYPCDSNSFNLNGGLIFHGGWSNNTATFQSQLNLLWKLLKQYGNISYMADGPPHTEHWLQIYGSRAL